LRRWYLLIFCLHFCIAFFNYFKFAYGFIFDFTDCLITLAPCQWLPCRLSLWGGTWLSIFSWRCLFIFFTFTFTSTLALFDNSVYWSSNVRSDFTLHMSIVRRLIKFLSMLLYVRDTFIKNHVLPKTHIYDRVFLITLTRALFRFL
jgi:hypothetical protein